MMDCSQTVSSWYLVTWKEKKKTVSQRQTRTVTTIDRDTGEGKMEPQWGCCHSAPPSLLEAERSSVSSSNRWEKDEEKHWNSSSFAPILSSALTYGHRTLSSSHRHKMHSWSAWYPRALLMYSPLTPTMLAGGVWHYPHGDRHGN